MQLRIVNNLSDPAVPAVIELYQSAFPVREQMYASFFWRVLQEESVIRLVVVEREAQLIGFHTIQIEGDEEPAYLWYIAVQEAERGNGVGKRLYESALEMVTEANAPAMMFEVETPEEAFERAGEDAARIAQKRIAWYQRLGAKCLNGVQFDCGTDWQASIPMLPMIHPLQEGISAEQAYDWGVEVLADGDPQNFLKTGNLQLI